jgi:hypothetical protein
VGFVCVQDAHGDCGVYARVSVAGDLVEVVAGVDEDADAWLASYDSFLFNRVYKQTL